jgi:hypothetical protein
MFLESFTIFNFGEIMQKPNSTTVSIIVPTKNRSDLLARCLESIRNDIDASSYNSQVIIVDGGCDNNTLEVVTSYKEIVSLHIREQDNGVSEAVNKGLAHATSEWVRFLGDDDELVVGAMDRAIDYCRLNPAIDICIGHAELYHQIGNCITPFSVIQPLGEITFASMFDIGNCDACGIGWPSPEVSISRTSLFKRTGGYDIHYHYLAYWELWLRQLQHGAKCYAIPCTLARRYLTERSDTMSGSNIAISNERIRIKWAYGGLSWLLSYTCKSNLGILGSFRAFLKTSRLIIRAHYS